MTLRGGFTPSPDIFRRALSRAVDEFSPHGSLEILGGQLELDHMLPTVAKIVRVADLVTRTCQELVQLVNSLMIAKAQQSVVLILVY